MTEIAAAELAELATRHFPTTWRTNEVCVRCPQPWPCDAARLLAAYEALAAERDDLKERLANDKFDTESHASAYWAMRAQWEEGRAQLATLAAERDRLAAAYDSLQGENRRVFALFTSERDRLVAAEAAVDAWIAYYGEEEEGPLDLWNVFLARVEDYKRLRAGAGAEG